MTGGCAGSAPAAAEISDTDGVDIDLTELNANMVYAQMYSVMESPGDYLGKTFKMRGPYYAAYYDETDAYYHFILIEDALACCAQGLEFKWDGYHIFPVEYPEEWAPIELTGVFSHYEEDGEDFFYLAVEDIIEV